MPRFPQDIALLPDAGPLITPAYAQPLDVLFKPGWRVMVVDMVLHEVTRTQTPTSEKLAAWAEQPNVQMIPTQTLGKRGFNRAPRGLNRDFPLEKVHGE